MPRAASSAPSGELAYWQVALSTASGRGRLLHFFANHELLAMELMALTLLKFPFAEKNFRLGLARTIVEEQKHLRMYVSRRTIA